MKKAYIDIETTGTQPWKHGIVQIALIVEIDGKIKEEQNIRMQPFSGSQVDEKALSVIGLTMDEINEFQSSRFGYRKFTGILSEYVNKYDKNDKFTFIGYNSRFDDDFLRAWFKKEGDNYYGSFFWWPALDIANLAAFKIGEDRSKLFNFKLATVAEYLGIEVDEEKTHDALYDIQLTRDLYYKLLGTENGNNE